MDEIRIILNNQNIPNNLNVPNNLNNPNIPNNQITQIIQNLAQRKKGCAPIGTAPTLSVKELYSTVNLMSTLTVSNLSTFS